ncbi:aminotransferase class V-fold PLP-dependent enzyme [Pararhizobium mangrovi]|uniref:Aminotransferase class V-fold PLP-dependent enzyme n=1 Tax=Pararhizobium mangrovi TaxID=2590452 RepID=A0A506UBA6_9HYPH|nr:aminotransferase class V-fold PLP-dependent enzyme [Pararhizobium mangrovi]TPW30656.1 aminotransferase class V-fold PLP-dependent enzyme [Pararhizobium mangrovi]
MAHWQDFYTESGLPPVINASGTMTGLGASIARPEVAEAMASILPRFVNMHALQAKASEAITRLTGGEAGFVTCSASAGVTQMVAATMTGCEPSLVERLPSSEGMANEVVMQLGHMCHYGAPVEQAVRLAGARVVPVGTSTLAQEYSLAGSITEKTAAALYVVSHHVVEYGQIPLDRFVAICHARNVPVIVDAASEYDLGGFLETGADIVVYSAHKFLSGPTAGIVAGRKDLVRAGYMQNMGIARGMKVGKESIYGTIAALEAWERRDHAAVRAREQAALEQWKEAASGLAGVLAEIVPDPTNNPLDRLRIHMNPREAGASVKALAHAMAAGDPPVIVRAHESELGWIQLDPCNLIDGQAEIVAQRLRETLERAARSGLEEPKYDGDAGVRAYMNWPD